MKIAGCSAVWKGLSSLKLTLACLILLMALVVACTLAQARLGSYGAVQTYMRSLFVYWPAGPSWSIPIFPGGGFVGLLLLLNLLASQFSRMELSWRKAGLWIVHLGLALLFVGEFVTGIFQVETQMALDEGATLNYSESARDVELALIDATEAGSDKVYSIPERLLVKQRVVVDPRLPFEIAVKKYLSESPKTNEVSDEQERRVTAMVELIQGKRSAGTWLLATGQTAAASFVFDGRAYLLALRPARRYLPVSLTLKKFRHQVYPGTDIPSHFSSLIGLSRPDGSEQRDVLISMNNPLRYGGRSFYQASFGKNGTMSVLQVVENPGRPLPYLSCALVTMGLLIHFLLRLRPMIRQASP